MNKNNILTNPLICTIEVAKYDKITLNNWVNWCKDHFILNNIGLDSPISQLVIEDMLSYNNISRNVVRYSLYVTQDNKKVQCGFADLTIRSKDTIEVGLVIALSEYRGQGLGSVFLEQLVYVATNILGFNIITLRVLSNNLPAIRCYEKFGFKYINKVFNYKIDKTTQLPIHLLIYQYTKE